MKKNKKNIGSALLDALIELVLALICLGIGVFIFNLFGVDFKSSNIDYDLLILLGVVIFFVIFGIVYSLLQWIKKMVKNKRNSN